MDISIGIIIFKGVELEIRSETTKISEADASVDYTTWLTGQRTSSR